MPTTYTVYVPTHLEYFWRKVKKLHLRIGPSTTYPSPPPTQIVTQSLCTPNVFHCRTPPPSQFLWSYFYPKGNRFKVCFFLTWSTNLKFGSLQPTPNPLNWKNTPILPCFWKPSRIGRVSVLGGGLNQFIGPWTHIYWSMDQYLLVHGPTKIKPLKKVT